MNTETPSQQSAPEPTQAAPRGRRGRRRLFALLIGLTPFIILELTLRVLGVGTPTDLHAGFGTAPLFELSEDEQTYRTALAREQFFVADEFDARKPDKEFRIFCLGGSTVQGRPFRPETSFGGWMQVELNARDSTRTYRTVNCGGISYASYRLRPVLAEVLNYEPNLIIIATGHNEFLEDRTYSGMKSRSTGEVWMDDLAGSLHTVAAVRELLGTAARKEPGEEDDGELPEKVETRLDNDAGYASYHRDEKWYQQVCEQYRDSVDEMVTMCEEAEVPLVLVHLGSNLRDCPPFKSEHAPDLSVEDEQRWQQLFETATRADDPARALDLYLQAEELDPTYPLLQYRVGRCFDRLGQPEKALAAYRSARDLDVCPLRMVSQMEENLLEIARRREVPLIDVRKSVAALGPDSTGGQESYIDHVHPNINSHQVIASLIVKHLVKAGTVSGVALSKTQIRDARKQHVRALSTAYFANGGRRIGWLEGWARRQRLFDETQPTDGRSYQAAALRYLELRKLDDAKDMLEGSFNVDPQMAEDLVGAAARLFQSGRPFETDWLLDRLEESMAHLQPMIDHARQVMNGRATSAEGSHPEWKKLSDAAMNDKSL